MVALGAHRLQRRDPLLDLELGDRRRWRHLIEEVPVRGERLGDGPQLLELHAGREAEDDDRLMCGFVDEPVHEPFPARVERNTRRDLVADLDARRKAGLDREFGEQPLRERVQRADRGAVEVVERSGARGVGRGMALQLRPDAVPQLRRRLLGERDGGDVAHRDARSHQADDAADQRGGLPGARTGFDEQRARRARCGSPRARRRHRSVA